jgi:predicted RNA-binding protein YlxR (DUF448 family)
MRRCVACRESKPQDELMRFTFDGVRVTADTDRKNDGRGFYLCRDRKCVEKAIKSKSFNRILRSAVDTEKIMRVTEEALNSN